LQSGHVLVNVFDVNQEEEDFESEIEAEELSGNKQFPVFKNCFESFFDGPISDVSLFSRNKFFPLYDCEQFKNDHLKNNNLEINKFLPGIENSSLFDKTGFIDLLVCGSIGYAVVCFDIMSNGLLNSEMLPKSFECDSVDIFIYFYLFLFLFYFFVLFFILFFNFFILGSLWNRCRSNFKWD
jgi:hypothetical protein